jgi:hypothetical protein
VVRVRYQHVARSEVFRVRRRLGELHTSATPERPKLLMEARDNREYRIARAKRMVEIARDNLELVSEGWDDCRVACCPPQPE